MAFRRKRCLPGEQGAQWCRCFSGLTAARASDALRLRAVFSEYLTDASERLDVKAAANRISRGFQAVSSALGLDLQLQTPHPCSDALTLDPKATAALRRLQQRAPGPDLLQLVFVCDAEQWEQAFSCSFATGKYLDLSPDTLQEQVRVAAHISWCLWLGLLTDRSLAGGAGVSCVAPDWPQPALSCW
jgi:hypothetical protein